MDGITNMLSICVKILIQKRGCKELFERTFEWEIGFIKNIGSDKISW